MNYETTIDGSGAVALNTLPEGEAPEFAGGATSSRRKLVIGAIVVLLVVGAWWALHGSSAPAEGENTTAQAQVVSVVVPGQTTITGAINASGTIAARREMPVGVAGEGGQVTQVLVDAGDWVRAGQVLAVIDRSVQSQQIASQSANIAVADADARLAQANLDRALRLVEKGFISKADIDRLTATRDAANARVRVARAGLGELGARAARLNIVAPAAGLVLTRAVEPGQVVSSGSGVLFSLARDGQMEMQARLSESDIGRLSVGSIADVTPVGTTRVLKGEVWQLSPTIDLQSRQGIARIALAYDASLRPGGFASANLRSGTVVAPLLPESAILSDDKGAFVFVVGSDNKVQRREVKTGEVSARGISVVQGLSGNEKVVLRAGGFLNAGDLVQPVPAPAAAQPAQAK